MSRLKVAVLADMLEEGWPSMDLVADMLTERLRTEHAGSVDVTLVRPALRRRATQISPLRSSGAAFTADRFTNRLFDYPRYVRKLARRFDIFHVVDHSYAQLVHELPAERTVVTCHDLDTFRSVLEPLGDPRSRPFRRMTRHILAGVQRAGHVACDTEATRDALVARAGVAAERTTVVPNGPHPSCTPEAEPAADVEAARLLGPAGTSIELLHVGSTIARKRIDVLLHVFARILARHGDARLVRVGGPFTGSQRMLARELHIDHRVTVLPFLDRSTLASVYRRSAAVLLPSEREGFGLPVLEALACGTPVIASDITSLREVGADAVTYCPPEEVDAWVAAVTHVLDVRLKDPEAARQARRAGVERAAAFSWSRYAADVTAIYSRLASGASR